MIKKIVTAPLFLSQKSIEATQADVFLAQDLRDTLASHRKHCVGMAANMIGVSKRVIIIQMAFFDLVMFNPVVTQKSGLYQTQESCLSLSGSRVTERYEEITVRFYDEKWLPKTLTLTGLEAQICQHELDHLEGILI